MLSGIQSALRLSLDAIKMKSTFSLFTFTLYSHVTHFCTNRESVLRVEPRPAVTRAVGGPIPCSQAPAGDRCSAGQPLVGGFKEAARGGQDMSRYGVKSWLFPCLAI